MKIGALSLGGGADILVQSMLSYPASDYAANKEQAKALYLAGCQIIRTAVPNVDAVKLIPLLKEATPMPVVADIHFDYRLALESVAAGADKIRINPGNIGDSEKLHKVVDACQKAKIPIRVGINAGSLEKEILAKYGRPTAEALAESALKNVALLEEMDFSDIVISIKTAHVPMMISANRILAEKTDYPLHLGVTEAGTLKGGVIKSAMGIGSLLCDGIGDTIRVSLTADPVEEIAAAKEILKSAGLLPGPQLISCPTCGRCRINVMQLSEQVETLLQEVQSPVTVAVMGCAVNGPGEARQADFGIAGGVGEGLIFAKGEILEKLPEEKLLPRLKQLLIEHSREDKA